MDESEQKNTITYVNKPKLIKIIKNGRIDIIQRHGPYVAVRELWPFGRRTIGTGLKLRLGTHYHVLKEGFIPEEKYKIVNKLKIKVEYDTSYHFKIYNPVEFLNFCERCWSIYTKNGAWDVIQSEIRKEPDRILANYVINTDIKNLITNYNNENFDNLIEQCNEYLIDNYGILIDKVYLSNIILPVEMTTAAANLAADADKPDNKERVNQMEANFKAYTQLKEAQTDAEIAKLLGGMDNYINLLRAKNGHGVVIDTNASAILSQLLESISGNQYCQLSQNENLLLKNSSNSNKNVIFTTGEVVKNEVDNMYDNVYVDNDDTLEKYSIGVVEAAIHKLCNAGLCNQNGEIEQNVVKRLGFYNLPDFVADLSLNSYYKLCSKCKKSTLVKLYDCDLDMIEEIIDDFCNVGICDDIGRINSDIVFSLGYFTLPEYVFELDYNTYLDLEDEIDLRHSDCKKR